MSVIECNTIFWWCDISDKKEGWITETLLEYIVCRIMNYWNWAYEILYDGKDVTEVVEGSHLWHWMHHSLWWVIAVVPVTRMELFQMSYVAPIILWIVWTIYIKLLVTEWYLYWGWLCIHKVSRLLLYHPIIFMKSQSAIKLRPCASCFSVQLIVSQVSVYGGTLLKFVVVTFLVGSAAWGFNWLIFTSWGECCTLQMPIASWRGVWRWRDRECNGFSSWPKRRRVAGNIVSLEKLHETSPSPLTSWSLMFMFVWNENVWWFNFKGFWCGVV